MVGWSAADSDFNADLDSGFNVDSYLDFNVDSYSNFSSRYLNKCFKSKLPVKLGRYREIETLPILELTLKIETGCKSFQDFVQLNKVS